ncbi:MAG: hypothetical protein AB7O65_07290 [Candidatus Korobacteraceae bacterium]
MNVYRSILFVVLAAGIAVAQGKAGIDPMAGNGAVRNDLYTNTHYGFTFKFPTTWKIVLGPDSIAAQGGCAGEQCRLLTIQAQSGIGRVEIVARDLPAGTTARDQLAKMAEMERAMGFQGGDAPVESAAGEWKLQRVDLQSTTSNGDILETLMATEAKGDAIFITILTNSRDTLGQLTSAMQATSVAAAKPAQSRN